MESKPWYLSKTVWLNVASFVVLVLTLPEVGELIPESGVRYVAALNAILNLYLRWGTNVPLSRTGGGQ